MNTEKELENKLASWQLQGKALCVIPNNAAIMIDLLK
jgi:hypothetical protein